MRCRTERTSTFSRMYRLCAAALRGVAEARCLLASERTSSASSASAGLMDGEELLGSPQ